MASVPHKFSPDIEAFIHSYARDIADGTAAVFAGAGLSVASGYVNWSALMKDIAKELGLDVDRESNLVAIAQYHLNERRNRTRINQTIIDEFSVGHAVNENHQILARLPISTYWTTNYDRMIETSLEANGNIVDVKYTVEHLKVTKPGRTAVVYKMHGDVSHPDTAVLTKDDYEGYFRDFEPFVTALAGDLVSKTMLFVGFSFTDPNIDYIMSRVRVALRHKPKQHYCILRRESKKAKESKADFEYRKRQQDYFVKDLARIGIHALMIDDFADITRILRAVESSYRTRTVFVSGSAHEFDPWRPDDAARFMESLSSTLVRKGLNIVTGFGLGVGPSIIAGALREITENPGRRSPKQLHAAPFPVDTGGTPERVKLYARHRESLIEKAGIVIFLFGNKRANTGAIVPAEGVREEFAIAKSLGRYVIPVGATGWVAKEIGDELAPFLKDTSKSFQRAYAIANNAKSTPEAITKAIVTMVQECRDH